MKLLITQPTFLPWIGYFDLIDDSDVVVFLDDVQFEKRSWQQRNRIITKNGFLWLTIPVKVKSKRNQLIKDVFIDENQINLQKIKKTIIHNYIHSKYFNVYQEEFFEIFSECLKNNSLLNLNLSLIFWLLKILKINKKIYLSSEFNLKSKSTQKLVDILNILKIDNYLSTSGSKLYLEEDKNIIQANKINIFLHNYKHPVYNQCYEPFTNYASIIDLLFNEGDDSYKILKSGSSKFTKLLL